jgi:signal peptidase I
MTDREFRALSKAQLIDILLKQESIIEQLENDKKALEDNINDKQIKIEKAGSLADASVVISGLLNSAQETADLYLDNIITIEAQKLKKLKLMEDEAREKTEVIYKSADNLLSEAFSPFIELVTEANDLFNSYSVKLDLAQKDYNKILEDMGFSDLKRKLDKRTSDILKEFGDSLEIPENLGLRINTENGYPEDFFNESIETAETFENENIRPSANEINEEIKRGENKPSFIKNIAVFAGILAVLATASVLVSTYLLPVFNISQNSMNPTLKSGEIVVFSALGEIEKGDIVAFRHSGSILIKRVIGKSGDLIDINDNGEVLLNGVVIDEPYINGPDLGQCDIELPFLVPEGRYFVMGDNRACALDSRYKEIGSVSDEQIEGKALARVLPFDEFELF